jgi:hypothetical protein
MAVASLLRYQVPKWLAFAAQTVAGTGPASTEYTFAANLDMLTYVSQVKITNAVPVSDCEGGLDDHR